MKATEAIAATLMTSDMVMKGYLSDLTDAELMTRPHPDCQHIAWQLGHLIASESSLLAGICPGHELALPEGFAEQHSKATADSNDISQFHGKQAYLDLFDQSEKAIRGALDSLSDADLDAPSPESMRGMFPTVGHVLVLLATHRMMHAGQWVPVRRALQKPIVI